MYSPVCQPGLITCGTGGGAPRVPFPTLSSYEKNRIKKIITRLIATVLLLLLTLPLGAVHAEIIVVPLLPDLQVTLTLNAESFPTGQEAHDLIEVTVANGGAGTAFGQYQEVQAAYQVAAILSTDQTLPDLFPSPGKGFKEDMIIGEVVQTKTLPFQEERVYSISVIIPYDTPPGDYYLAVIADYTGTVVETNETNNVAMLPTKVLAADDQPHQSPGPDSHCETDLFTDLPKDHPACSAINLLVGKGIVSGYPDGTFQPDKSVTRAEFSKLFVLAMGEEPLPGQSLAFSDTQGHWAAAQGHLQAAVGLGALSGFPDGSFKPDDPVTRAQGVKIAVTGMGGLDANGDAPKLYADIPLDPWYRPYVAQASKVILIHENAAYPVFTGTKFAGDTPMTRAEAALLLANVIYKQSQKVVRRHTDGGPGGSTLLDRGLCRPGPGLAAEVLRMERCPHAQATLQGLRVGVTGMGDPDHVGLAPPSHAGPPSCRRLLQEFDRPGCRPLNLSDNF
ncbi:MAG: S-layer homology domain-containing protein [Bacillota bacterium]